MNHENAAAMVREGATHALNYVSQSSDPAAARAAKALLLRLRMEQLRGAAVFASSVPKEAPRMREEHGSVEAAVGVAQA